MVLRDKRKGKNPSPEAEPWRLPALPAGYRWRVMGTFWDVGEVVYDVQLQKKVFGLFWKTQIVDSFPGSMYPTDEAVVDRVERAGQSIIEAMDD